jgi:integrase
VSRPFGTGTLMERDGRLLVQWRVMMPDGKTKRLTKRMPKGATKTDAQNWLRKHAGVADAAPVPQPQPKRKEITFGELAGLYVDKVIAPCITQVGTQRDDTARLSYHCASAYRSNLRLHVLPRWAETPLSQFSEPETIEALESWLGSLWRTDANPDGYAPKTVRAIFLVMSLVFRHGVKWCYLQMNPMTRVDLPRGSTKRVKQPVTITVGQFFTLTEALPLREKVAVTFAGWLGPRISEAFGLQWGDLDLVKGVVTFRRGFVGGRITPLKTEASRTDLPMPMELVELLREWQGTTLYQRPTDWVFASPYTNGARPLWPDSLLHDHVKPIAQRLGLPKIGWHTFRHSMVAWGKEAGLTLEQGKTLARHEDLATTSNIYGRLDLDAKRVAQERLVAYVRGQVKEATPVN